MMHSIVLSGPYRLLRINVNMRKASGNQLMGVLGHELQHAVEVLSHPELRNNGLLLTFYEHEGMPLPGAFGAFETTAALRAGDKVEEEVRQAAKHTGK